MTDLATAEAGFLAAIIAEPDDDGHRLAFADWLDEHGRGERAELIRVQCEMETMLRGCSEPYGDLTDNPRWQLLLRRERELIQAHATSWLDGSVPGAVGWHSHSHLGFALPDGDGVLIGWGATFRRGMIEDVECLCGEFLRHGPTLARCQPLRTVTLTDLRPRCAFTKPHWTSEKMRSEDHCGVPPELWAFLSGGKLVSPEMREYDTEQDALADLSAGAIRWARAQPGGVP